MRKLLVTTFYSSLMLVLSCKTRQIDVDLISTNETQKKDELTKEEILNWYTKDPKLDSISGISLNQAYKHIQNKTYQALIVAYLDSDVDVNHEDLINTFWVNKGEIPNNKLDDDNNGYIDDVNGWNFLGIKDSLQSILYANYDAMRIIRKFKKDSLQSIKSSINSNKLFSQHYYDIAKKQYIEKLRNIENSIKKYVNYLERYEKSVGVLKPFLEEKNYSEENFKALKTKDTSLINDINTVQWLFSYNYDGKWLGNYVKELKVTHSKSLNLKYNERLLIDDDVEDLDDIDYGNNKISQNLDTQTHATRISGVIGGKGNDNISKGILKDSKIMPVVIQPYIGNEHDKDIALGIRYAVDNGAKVINMSFGKSISFKSDWVFNAIKYAENKNVLLVTSAGNNAENGDLEENFRYPNDNDYGKPEVADNFLMVGSTNRVVDSTFVSSFSNYGKENVDLFAPGNDFVTAWPGNKYKKDGGTSISAAVVSGIAGLIFQYYPNLTASQVKHILMDSGISYDLEVIVGKGDNKKKLPFSELSKSGKVVNAYNAVLMAEQISKKSEKK